MPYFQGCDPGVSFISSYDPDKKLLVVLISNYGDNVWRIKKKYLIILEIECSFSFS
jgi:hypothetical protein